MKRTIKWIGMVVITPILLFTLLAVLLYLPPIQNWAVQKVMTIASEKTGMEISVSHINLEFPLNLGIEGFRMIHQNDSLPQVHDTIADVRKLVVNVKLIPLLRKQIVIDELSLQQTKISTNGFISDLRIQGDIEELWLSSKGINLTKEHVELNGVRLSGGKIDIELSDTAETDTTVSDQKWFIHADSLCFTQTDISLHLLNDSLHVGLNIGYAIAQQTAIDLDHNIYMVESLDWQQGTLSYDNDREPMTPGFDYNHLALNNINSRIDSISYTPEGISFIFRQTMLKEKSGLEITALKGGVKFSPDFNNLKFSELTLRTSDSDILADTDIDFNAFDKKETSGKIKLCLFAQLGKQDLVRFMGNLPQRFIERYPNQPLSIKGSIGGNSQLMEFTGLDITLPNAFHLTSSGTAENISDLQKLKADIIFNAQTQNVSFITALLDPATACNICIPYGICLDGKLQTNGPQYIVDMAAHEGNGMIKTHLTAVIPQDSKDELNTRAMTYDTVISIQNLNLHHFLPNDSLYQITAAIHATGRGTDILNNRNLLKADATISQLYYGYWNLRDLTATAHLEKGRGIVSINSHNELLNGAISIDALLNTKRIDGTLSADIAKADLQKLRIVNNPLVIGVCGHIDITSDMEQAHRVSGILSDLFIQDKQSTFHPDNIGILLNTDSDTTYARVQSGDFIVKFDAAGGYKSLLRQVTTLTDSLLAQYDQKVIDQPAIKRLLPTMKLHMESKCENPIANLLHTSDIGFKELLIDINTSPVSGINGQSHIYALDYDSIRIDTLRVNLTQKDERLTYQAQIRNNRKNPQFVFNTYIDGHIHQHGATTGIRYFDDRDKLGVRIGATVEMEDSGIRFKLIPERPTIGYKEFNLNSDNYIFLGSNKKIQAKIDLIADDRTGMKIYTEHQDSTMMQDLTISLNHIDLGEVTSVLPYLPKITGKLNGDYHILQDFDGNISAASDMAVSNMTYEKSPIGNISTELVYLQKEDDTHAIEARLLLDNKEFGLLSGTYQHKGEGAIDANFTMNRMPLSLINGFVPNQLIGLDGFGEGDMTIRGTLKHPNINGEVYVDSAYLVSAPYGIRLRFDNDPIRIVDSQLLLENFGLYAYNDEPLNLMGNIDFSDTDHISTDLRMRAQNLLLINAKQEANSLAFGRAFVNFFARLQGPLDELKMRGRLDVLGSTEITYMLLDSPLSADNRLNELVKFTDFSDSTQTVVKRPAPNGLTIDLNINISEGAHIVCNLNPEQTNYVDLMGGGDLRMKYTHENINLTGRYTLSNGEMKYSLPVIPLKTFNIKNGSHVEFTGDPRNPKLNITATERTKATVENNNGVSRSVAFDCGVVITKTLNDMGLQFFIDAPEDNDIHSELQAMSVEEQGKVAVTMLTTSMYLADGNTSGFSMNSALSSFLQSEINNITGSALKTLDLSVGIDNATNASGSMHTDYSFKFAKRFFNNRLKIEIGGVVSSGASNEMGQKQSFFDNVSMEYRLNENATKNVKLFYKQNVYDWLDGYTSMYGAGFVWRRKFDKFWDIFTIWRKEQQPVMLRHPEIQHDSLKIGNVKTGSIK